MTVRAEPGELSVGENLSLTIDVISEPGVDITMPVINAALGAFEVVAADTPPDIPDGTKRRWTNRYTLRTLDSGEQEIPAITLKFADRRPTENAGEPNAIENELTSAAFTINVKSLLTGELNPEEFRDIKAEVAVPLPWNAKAWMYGGLAGVLALGALWLAVRLIHRARSRPIIAPPPLPPHILALRELDRLAADHLIERDEFREFYFRLTAIVRQYIEQRFAIMAVEQTTEEFLREARLHPALNDQHRSLLTDFLRQADMVKFAKFQPQQYEGEAAMSAARRYVQDTAKQSTDVADYADKDISSVSSATSVDSKARQLEPIR